VYSPHMQLKLAEAAGGNIEKCATGHMPIVSNPERAADTVKSVADEA